MYDICVRFQYIFFSVVSTQKLKRVVAPLNGVGGLSSKSRADHIGHTVANGLSTLRHFFERSYAPCKCKDSEMSSGNPIVIRFGVEQV